MSVCNTLASWLRTPILYVAAYIPASVVLETPGGFRRRSLEWLVEGSVTVLRIQRAVSPHPCPGSPASFNAPRTPQLGAGKSKALDWIMSRLSDLCDSDFYFIMCPFLFW